MAYGSINADSIVTSVSGGVLGGGNASIMKNRIINGGQVINQRAGGTVNPTASTYTYITDRWNVLQSQSSKLTAAQSSTAPAGFNNSLLITSSSAYSITSTDQFMFSQLIEGYNIADLGWGTASAKTVTLSFWVQSSLTGTFGVVLKNNSSAYTYGATYTISAANTWEYKTITVAGPTGGTWETTSSAGIVVRFGLGVGSTYSLAAGSWSTSGYYDGVTGATSLVGTSGATFYITGVQLEVGSSATGFEYVNYQTSLANCQRYYEVVNYSTIYIAMSSVQPAGGNNRFYWFFKTIKRANATMALVTGSWVNTTPTVVGKTTNAEYYSGSTFFYAEGTEGNVALSASAEL
jgi:hypothetical protein